MLTCSRCALLGLALFALALAGCDSSGPGRDLDAVDGVYTLEVLTFDPVTSGLPTADVGARLDNASTTLEIFGADGEALLRIRPVNGAGASRVDFEVGAANGRLALEATDQNDRDDLADILLPESFALTYAGRVPSVLEGRFELSGVDLQAFDPDLYQDQRSNRGTLTVRFRR